MATAGSIHTIAAGTALIYQFMIDKSFIGRIVVI